MSVDSFVDSNVLIYAHDADAGPKREIAARLVIDLWRERRGILSTQVLQEFYVNVTRKIRKPLSRSTARAIVRGYAAWRVVGLDTEHLLRASEFEERHQLSFWDGMILAAASHAGAVTVLSEDFTHGRRFDGMTIENPFRSLA